MNNYHAVAIWSIAVDGLLFLPYIIFSSRNFITLRGLGNSHLQKERLTINFFIIICTFEMLNIFRNKHRRYTFFYVKYHCTDIPCIVWSYLIHIFTVNGANPNVTEKQLQVYFRSWVQQINSDQKSIKSYARKHAFLTDYLQQQKI